LVATAQINQFVDLEKLIGVEGFHYDPAVYRCAYLKDGNTRGKISVFSSGKMICVGAKSLEDAERNLEYASRRLAELGLVGRTKIVVRLQNIVAIGEIGRPIDIERLAGLPNVLYEPEQFPGAICHPEELEGASILVFASGKVVFTGLKSHQLLDSARHVLEKLSKDGY